MSSNTKQDQDEEMAGLAKILKEAQSQDSLANSKDDKAELDQLKADYIKSIEENDQLKDQLLRTIADGENLRKRTAKQIDDAGKFAINNFSKDLIEVLENLYLATDNIPSEVLEENKVLISIFKGIEMTKTTLLNVFDKYGIKRITPQVGEIFDHNFHEAVSQIEQPEFAPNSIVSIMRSGYTLNDRLLKPAMVIVAKGN